MAVLCWPAGCRCPPAWCGRAVVSAVTSSSGMGDRPGAVFLLGYHLIQPGLEIIPRGWYGIHGVKECDSALKPTAVVAQLKRRERVQGVLRLFDSFWLSRHR